MKKKMGLSITILNLRGRRLLILSSPAQSEVNMMDAR